MIVIADTGRLNYLVLIGEIQVLPKLYHRIAVPLSVRDELSRLRAPEPVRRWIESAPSWLEIRCPSRRPDASLGRLDVGERDAIRLAEELHATQIIIDEIRGRREAQRRGLPYTGTLGVLSAAARLGLLDLRNAVERLRQTSFHVSEEILVWLLEDR